MAEIKYTQAQYEAITAELKEDILVSAGAGSGKTAVLSERIAERAYQGLTDPAKILVLTFTEQAAGNMRRRIEKQLAAKSLENPQRYQYLKYRIMQSRISTIHSFCLYIIRRFSYKDEKIPEAAKVLDAAKAELYLDESIAEALEESYNEIAKAEEAGERPGIFAEYLIKASAVFESGLSDEGFKASIKYLINYMRSIPYYQEKIINDLRKNYQELFNFGDSECCKYFTELTRKLINASREDLEMLENHAWFQEQSKKNKLTKETEGLINLFNTLHAFYADYEKFLLDTAKSKSKNIAAAYWDFFAVNHPGDVVSLRKPAANSKNADLKAEFIEIYKANTAKMLQMLTGSLKSTAVFYQDIQGDKYPPVFQLKVDELIKAYAESMRIMSALIKIAIRADEIYAAKKFDASYLDYSDFEHFSLKLLDDADLRQTLQERFDEIYLDEYQDTNDLQEAIIKKIAKNNLFMVGDIKQSIYRFREANPQLFLDRMQKNRTIYMQENFRSEAELIELINYVFSFIMTKESAETDYDEKQALKAGRAAKETFDKNACKIMIIDRSEDRSESESLPRNNADSAIENSNLIAEELKAEFMSGFIRNPIREEALMAVKEIMNCDKPLGEIAILGRTHNILREYAEVLKFFAIPYSLAGQVISFQSREFELLKSLILLLDNFQNDIPLAAVMLSELSNEWFNTEDLLKIAAFKDGIENLYPQEKYGRQLYKKENDLTKAEEKLMYDDSLIEEDASFFNEMRIGFAQKFLLYMQAGEDDVLRNRCKSFYKEITVLREISRAKSPGEVLDEVFKRRSYLDILSFRNNAERRIAEAEKFKAMAENYTQRAGGIHDFARFIEKIEASAPKIKDLNLASPEENAISLMTVHASKGLEFPIVFFAGSSGKFSKSSTKSLYTATRENGITPMNFDYLHDTVYNSPQNYLQERIEAKAERAEEYRLLYVAMTRAREKFNILGRFDYKNSESKIAEFYQKAVENGKRLTEELSEDADNPLTLFLTAAKMRAADEKYTESAQIAVEKYQYEELSDQIFELQCRQNSMPKTEIKSERATEAQENVSLKVNDASVKRIKSLLSDFPYQDELKRLPAKLSVSGLNVLSQDVKTQLLRQIYLKESAGNINSKNHKVQKTESDAIVKEQRSHVLTAYPEKKVNEVEAKHDKVLKRLNEQESLAASDDNFAYLEHLADRTAILEKKYGRSEIDNDFLSEEGVQIKDMPLQIRKHEIEDQADAGGFGTLVHALLQRICAIKVFYERQQEPEEPDEAIFAVSGYKLLRKPEAYVRYLQALQALEKAKILGTEEADTGSSKEVFTMLYDFYASEIGRYVINNDMAKRVSREQNFTKAFDLSAIPKKYAAKTLVQGVIDLMVEEEDNITIIDFKSDNTEYHKRRLKIDSEEYFERQYGFQLRMYAAATEFSLKKPVKNVIIWSLREGKAYKLSNA